MRVDGFREGGSDAVKFADVLRDADALAAFIPDALSGGFDLVGRAGEDRYFRSGLRETGCDLQVDAAGNASDESGFAGEEIVAPSVEMPPKVVNLMEALKKSLDTVSANKKPAAKADLKVVKKAAKTSEPKRRRA